MPWRPGQQPNRALEAPYEDLPPHLSDLVHVWIRAALSSSNYLVRDIVLELRLAMPDPTKTGNHGPVVDRLMKEVYDDDGFALDLVELLLASRQLPSPPIENLDEILEKGHSAYRVNESYDGLELAVLPELKEQALQTVQAAEQSAGEHLAAAWNAAYGRTTDPEKAYDRAIKAAESALRPIVTPNDNRATLTKMIRAVHDAPQKWVFALEDYRPPLRGQLEAADGVQVLLEQMKLLAYGQRQRHGSDGPVELNSDSEARTAVLIAITLVQYATSGAIRPA